MEQTAVRGACWEEHSERCEANRTRSRTPSSCAAQALGQTACDPAGPGVRLAAAALLARFSARFCPGVSQQQIEAFVESLGSLGPDAPAPPLGQRACGAAEAPAAHEALRLAFTHDCQCVSGMQPRGVGCSSQLPAASGHSVWRPASPRPPGGPCGPCTAAGGQPGHPRRRWGRPCGPGGSGVSEGGGCSTWQRGTAPSTPPLT
jgi:hypothetical protein